MREPVLRRLRRRRPFLAGAFLVAVAGACGDDGPQRSAEETEALATLIDAELTRDEETCLLDGLDDLGVPLDAIVSGSLGPEQDTEMLAVTLDCIDDLGAIPSFVDAFIAGAADEGLALTEEQARCAIGSMGESDAATAMAGCLDSPPTAGGGEFGDDPILDLLWEACGGGNPQACDELYVTSPLGSGYEEFARTCGGELPDSIGNRCFTDLG